MTAASYLSASQSASGACVSYNKGKPPSYGTAGGIGAGNGFGPLPGAQQNVGAANSFGFPGVAQSSGSSSSLGSTARECRKVSAWPIRSARPRRG